MTRYQALYRQWRPKTFAEIAGQEHITLTLLNALKSGRLVHAYLFCGPRGTGKTSTAKILAKAVNCKFRNEGEPCNECLNCKSIDTGNSMDVMEIDAASNRGIDEVRDLIEKIPLGPVEGDYKVYIIDEVHMLTTEAFNAILKTLEEPPGHTVFILATTEPRKVPPTIMSRCQRFDFYYLPAATIIERLQMVAAANGVKMEPGALSLLARKAGGGLRDALVLLDQVLASCGQETVTAEKVAATLGVPRLDMLIQVVDALADGDGAKILSYVDSALKTGVEPQRFFEELIDHTRNLLLLKTDSGAGRFTGLMAEEVEQVEVQAGKFDNMRLLSLLEKLQQGGASLRWSSQPRVILEMTLLGTLIAPEISLEDIARRVEILEKLLMSKAAVAAARLPHMPAQTFTRNGSRAAGAMGQEEKTTMENPGLEEVSKEQAGDTTVHKQDTGTGEAIGRTIVPGLETGLDMAAVRGKWVEVLAEARKVNVHLQAYLREGEPVSIDGRVLTVAVNTDFHRGMLEQQRNRQSVEKVLEKVFALPLQLSIVAGGEGQKTGGNKDNNEEIIKKFKDYFGPEKVEIIND